jgi:hypothetical protein
MYAFKHTYIHTYTYTPIWCKIRVGHIPVVHIRIYTYIHTYMHAYIHIHTHMVQTTRWAHSCCGFWLVCTCIYAFICTYIHICIYGVTYVVDAVFQRLRHVYLCIYTHTHICMYIWCNVRCEGGFSVLVSRVFMHLYIHTYMYVYMV